MKLIGLSGGIGSGKTTVALVFQNCGVPVYFADTRAKELMNTSSTIKKSIISLLGEESYCNNELQRKYVANRIFANSELRTSINKIVHPVVREDFENWAAMQKSEYVIQENALMFSSDSYKSFYKSIFVTCPEDIRIQRVIKRDFLSESQIMERIAVQVKDNDVISKANFVITNDNLCLVIPQVLQIHSELKKEIHG